MNRYKFEDLSVGMRESFSVTVTEQMMDAFCELSGDENPLHRNIDFAKNHGFSECVVYGMLTASFLSRLAGGYLPGERSLIQSVEVKFVKPVFVGKKLTVVGEVADLNDTVRQITLKVEIRNGKEKVLRGKMKVGVLDG